VAIPSDDEFGTGRHKKTCLSNAANNKQGSIDTTWGKERSRNQGDFYQICLSVAAPTSQRYERIQEISHTVNKINTKNVLFFAIITTLKPLYPPSYTRQPKPIGQVHHM
jgi:hypothetical protein